MDKSGRGRPRITCQSPRPSRPRPSCLKPSERRRTLQLEVCLLKAACCAALAVVMFRANLQVVVFTFYATTSCVYLVCFGYPHTKQNRGFSGAFSRLWQQLFSVLCNFLWGQNFAEVLLHDVVILSSPRGYLWRETTFSSSLPSDENLYRSH